MEADKKCISSYKNSVKFEINNVKPTISTSTRFLVVVVDENLNFDGYRTEIAVRYLRVLVCYSN